MTSLAEKPAWRRLQEEAAFAIVEYLGNDALTVNLANAYLVEHDILRENLTLYLQMLVRQSLSVLETHELPSSDHYCPRLATVFETSYTAINNTAFASAWLLILLAHLQSFNIDDRLFKEASMQLACLQDHDTKLNKFLLYIEGILIVATSKLLIKLILYILRNRRPNFEGRLRRYALMIMTIMPLVLESILMLIIYIIKHNQVRHGDVVQRDGLLDVEFVLILCFASIIDSLPDISDWLFGEDQDPWRLKFFPTLCSTTVIMVWALDWYLYGLDTIAEHTKVLMGRLDFSRADMFQFEAMLSGLHNLSREYLTYGFAWSLFWNIFIILAACFVVIILLLAKKRFVEFVVRRLESPQNTQLTKLGLALLKLSETDIGLFVLLFGLCFGMLWLFETLRVVNWIPWREEFREKSWNQTNLNSFLPQKNNNEWDPVAYAEAMSPLTRFGLVQRSKGEGYIMHPLVQWWAQQRLSVEEKKMFVSEAYRLLDLAYQSSGCWDDIFCQQMLIPHIAEVATADVLNDGTGFRRLKDLLKMLYRSLRKVGRV
ncbi:hypothetical protein BGZ63DRAFT_383257 [Mariannaea sp. PMI_226]|nr:hypothetical protein BGZ63DRAFT_383257 [Mariannaea sp. PMI_226]